VYGHRCLVGIMLEKRFPAVAPQLLSSDGTARGIVTVQNTTLFKVKQQVILSAATLPNLDTLEIKNILNSTQMVVGPRSGNIQTFTDISQYTVAHGAFIFANEQLRPNITSDDFERAVYEEEPVVAKRVILVDMMGQKIGTGLAPSGFDDVKIIRNISGDPTRYNFFLAGVLQSSIIVTYDDNGDAIDYQKVLP
jgi:hypothetical protein